MDFYQQSTEFTGAPSALLMVIHHFDPEFQLTRQNEFLLCQQTATLPIRAASIYAMACVAKQHGIKVKVFVGNEDFDFPDYRFKGYTKKEIDYAGFMYNLHRKLAHQQGISVVVKDFNVEEIKEAAQQGKIIMVRINIGILREQKALSHYVVVYGYSKKAFLVIDPSEGQRLVTLPELQQALDTLETKKKRDLRMLVFS